MVGFKEGQKVRISRNCDKEEYRGLVGEINYRGYINNVVESAEDLLSLQEPIEAEFEEVKKSSALAINLNRHPLMNDKETDAQKKLEDYATLASDLGLQRQVQKAQEDLIKEDVKELTQSKFHRVSKEALLNLLL